MTPAEQDTSVKRAPEEEYVAIPVRASPAEEPIPEQPTLFGDVPMTGEDGNFNEQEPFLDKVLAIEGTPSPVYLGSLMLGSVLLMGAAALGIFPWVASAIGIVGLLATMFRGGYLVTLVCSVAVTVIAVVAIWPRQPTLADATPNAGLISQSESATEEIPPGSLGFKLDELRDLWNSLDEPPRIDRGFSRSSESGPLDGFVIRFDQGASLAGAYDPDDDYVYALSASNRLDHESATTMYLHLCFILHPYSQECIDGYWHAGLDGDRPTDYLGTRHTAEWQIGRQTWRLAIVGNVQELKVLGEPPT